MELPIHQFPLMKLVVHMIQLVLVVVAWILCITILRSDADIDGRVGWYFALVSGSRHIGRGVQG